MKHDLTSAQQQLVDEWESKNLAVRNKSLKHSNHVFPNSDQTEDYFTTTDIQPPEHVNAFLQKSGYKVEDYRKGLARDIQNDRRILRIGKILHEKNAPLDIQRAYSNDPNRNNAKSNLYKIIYSRHPDDIAGCSTNKDWTSCLDMGTPKYDIERGGKPGPRFKELEHDITHGSMVAYLVHSHDIHNNKPLARVLIKPYHHKDSTIFYPEKTVYGNPPGDDFLKHVQRWSMKNFTPKPNTIYAKNSHVYDDNGFTHIFDNNTMSLDKLHDTISNNTKNYVKNFSLYGIANKDQKDHIVNTLLKQPVAHQDSLSQIAIKGDVKHQFALHDFHKQTGKLPESVLVDLVSYSDIKDHIDKHHYNDPNTPTRVKQYIAEFTQNPDIMNHIVNSNDIKLHHSLISNRNNDAQKLHRQLAEHPHNWDILSHKTHDFNTLRYLQKHADNDLHENISRRIIQLQNQN